MIILETLPIGDVTFFIQQAGSSTLHLERDEVLYLSLFFFERDQEVRGYEKLWKPYFLKRLMNI